MPPASRQRLMMIFDCHSLKRAIVDDAIIFAKAMISAISLPSRRHFDRRSAPAVPAPTSARMGAASRAMMLDLSGMEKAHRRPTSRMI